jgi:hypothetical protein
MNMDFLNLEVAPGVTVKTCFLGVLESMLRHQRDVYAVNPVQAYGTVKPIQEEFQCFEWCNNCPRECKCKSSHWILCPCANCKEDVEAVKKQVEYVKEEVPQTAGKRCHGCKQLGHIRANCTVSPTLKQCFICKERGHISVQCPSASIIGESRECYNCKKKGHVLLNCPDATLTPITSPKKLKRLSRRV